MLEIEWDEELLGREPQQARSIERVNRIFDISLDIIRNEGVNELKLNRVASEAGLPVGTVYQFFPTVSALVARLAIRFMDQHFNSVQNLYVDLKDADDFAATMEGFIWDIYNSIRQDPFIFELFAGGEADRLVRQINRLDDERLAKLLMVPILEFIPDMTKDKAYRLAQIVNAMMGTLCNRAAIQEKEEGDALMNEGIDACFTFLNLNRQK